MYWISVNQSIPKEGPISIDPALGTARVSVPYGDDGVNPVDINGVAPYRQEPNFGTGVAGQGHGGYVLGSGRPD